MVAHSHKHTAHVIQIFQKIKPIIHQTVCSQHAVLGGLTLNDYTCLTPALSPLYPAHTGQVVSFPEALRNLESSEANGTVSKYSVCLTRPWLTGPCLSLRGPMSLQSSTWTVFYLTYMPTKTQSKRLYSHQQLRLSFPLKVGRGEFCI